MKKLLVSLLSFATAVCFGEVTVVNYDPGHKDAVMEMCLQDSKQLVCGSAVVDMGLATTEQFNEEAKKVMEAVLADPNKIKWVVIDSGKVIGFVEFFMTKEQSVESILKQVKAQFPQLTTEQESQIAAGFSYLKKTDAECDLIGKIESIVVSKDFRRRGHARMLIKKAIERIKQAFPEIKWVGLDVNAANEGARKLYESEGFTQSAVQPQHLVMMQVVQYEKAL